MLVIALLLAASPLDGTWAPQPGMCRNDQAAEDAPWRIKGGRIDQHEAHCRIAPLKPAGPGRWTARGRCTVEGAPGPAGMFRFHRIGEILRIQEPDFAGARVLRRCR
jgi:hypothetical protein